eukprot:363490-Chlamydomonas_euryale.AAC.14
MNRSGGAGPGGGFRASGGLGSNCGRLACSADGARVSVRLDREPARATPLPLVPLRAGTVGGPSPPLPLRVSVAWRTATNGLLADAASSGAGGGSGGGGTSRSTAAPM